MWKLLAISGGVDSACLLHMMKNDPEVLVAHFNHGTRPSSNDDEKFVQKLAMAYGKKCIIGRANLGENVSEEKARIARYNFLSQVAKENQAEIYTAHHLDDLVETIAINLLRGTGWRGLAPFSAKYSKQPFLGNDTMGFTPMFKTDLLKYAAKNNLAFREDPTNHEDNYLRNRLREKLRVLPREQKLAVSALFYQQSKLRSQIENGLEAVLDTLGQDYAGNTYLRAWFTTPDEVYNLELLRTALARHNLSLTHPQLKDFLTAIKTYAPEKSFNLPGDRLVRLHKTYFNL